MNPLGENASLPTSAAEALKAIEDLRAKDWHFTLRVDKEGWTCDAVGAGLAHASCGGASLEEAVSLALSHAFAMEDDPNQVVFDHGRSIMAMVEAVYGPGVFLRFDVEEDRWDDGPKRILVLIDGAAGVEKMVDLDVAFYRKMGEKLPKDVFSAVSTKIVWPEEKAAGGGKS